MTHTTSSPDAYVLPGFSDAELSIEVVTREDAGKMALEIGATAIPVTDYDLNGSLAYEDLGGGTKKDDMVNPPRPPQRPDDIRPGSQDHYGKGILQPGALSEKDAARFVAEYRNVSKAPGQGKLPLGL